MAYRFISSLSGEHIIKNEKAVYRLSQNFETWAPYVRDRKKRKNATREQQFWNDMQNLYTYLPVQDFDANNLLFTPILVNLEHDEKLCIAEVDVEDYPGMYLAADNCRPQLQGVFAPYPRVWCGAGIMTLNIWLLRGIPIWQRSMHRALFRGGLS